MCAGTLVQLSSAVKSVYSFHLLFCWACRIIYYALSHKIRNRSISGFTPCFYQPPQNIIEIMIWMPESSCMPNFMRHCFSIFTGNNIIYIFLIYCYFLSIIRRCNNRRSRSIAFKILISDIFYFKQCLIFC